MTRVVECEADCLCTTDKEGVKMGVGARFGRAGRKRENEKTICV
jgi:hypothetical protein